MQKCPNCGQQNRPGVIFCENCGASLIGRLPLSTKALDSTDDDLPDVGVDSSTLTDVSIQGTATFEHGMQLRLEVEGNADPIHFNPKSETIFGRRDPATGDKPDIDLTPFAGYRMGVSRRHAAIRPGDENGLDLWDLGSSNGTFLNAQRLSAHRPYRLRDGDEIRLGQMVIHIYFEREASLTPVPPPAQVEAQASSEAPKPEAAPAAAPVPAASEDRPTEPFPPRPRPTPEGAEAKAGDPSGPPAPDRPAPSAPEPDQPSGSPAPDRPVPSAPEQAPAPSDAPAPQPDPEPKAEPPVPLDSKPETQAEQPAAPAPSQPEQPAPSAPVPTSPEAPKPVEPALPAEPPAPEPAPPEPKPSPDDDKSG